MKVTLNIENDSELREYIKECIKGQVLAIVRDDFKKTVKDEIVRKLSSIDDRSFIYLQKTAFDNAAKEIILTKNGISDWSNDFIKPLANEVLNKRIDKAISNIDWEKAIDTLATQKINFLLKNQG